MKAGMVQVAFVVGFLKDATNTPAQKLEALALPHGKIAKDEIQNILDANAINEGDPKAAPPVEGDKPEMKLAKQTFLDKFVAAHPLDGSSTDDGKEYINPFIKADAFKRCARQIACMTGPQLSALKLKNADNKEVQEFVAALVTLERLTKAFKPS